MCVCVCVCVCVCTCIGASQLSHRTLEMDSRDLDLILPQTKLGLVLWFTSASYCGDVFTGNATPAQKWCECIAHQCILSTIHSIGKSADVQFIGGISVTFSSTFCKILCSIAFLFVAGAHVVRVKICIVARCSHPLMQQTENPMDIGLMTTSWSSVLRVFTSKSVLFRSSTRCFCWITRRTLSDELLHGGGGAKI